MKKLMALLLAMVLVVGMLAVPVSAESDAEEVFVGEVEIEEFATGIEDALAGVESAVEGVQDTIEDVEETVEEVTSFISWFMDLLERILEFFGL